MNTKIKNYLKNYHFMMGIKEYIKRAKKNTNIYRAITVTDLY